MNPVGPCGCEIMDGILLGRGIIASRSRVPKVPVPLGDGSSAVLLGIIVELYRGHDAERIGHRKAGNRGKLNRYRNGFLICTAVGSGHGQGNLVGSSVCIEVGYGWQQGVLVVPVSEVPVPAVNIAVTGC